VRTQPISLVDPNLDGGADLLGAAPPQSASLAESPRDKLVRRGELPEAPAGRVDDYKVRSTK
jgi:hypothetical protein